MHLFDPARPKINHLPAYLSPTLDPIAPIPKLLISSPALGFWQLSAFLCIAQNVSKEFFSQETNELGIASALTAFPHDPENFFICCLGWEWTPTRPAKGKGLDLSELILSPENGLGIAEASAKI